MSPNLVLPWNSFYLYYSLEHCVENAITMHEDPDLLQAPFESVFKCASLLFSLQTIAYSRYPQPLVVTVLLPNSNPFCFLLSNVNFLCVTYLYILHSCTLVTYYFTNMPILLYFIS